MFLPAAHCCSCKADRRLVFEIFCDFLPSVLRFICMKYCVCFCFLSFLKLWLNFMCFSIMKDQVKLFLQYQYTLCCISVLCHVLYAAIYIKKKKKMTNPLDNYFFSLLMLKITSDRSVVVFRTWTLVTTDAVSTH